MDSRNSVAPAIVYLRIEEVAERTKLSRSTIYNKINPKSKHFDPDFPRQVKLGKSAARWVEADLERWCASRLAAQNGLAVKEEGISIAVQTTHTPQRHEKTAPLVVDDLQTRRHAFAQKLLEENAANGSLLSYRELMSATMLSPEVPDDWRAIDEILDTVSRQSYSSQGVLLAVLVRDKRNPDSLPRDSFFKMAASLGFKYNDVKEFLEEQLLLLLARYRDPKYQAMKKISWVLCRNKYFAL